MVKKWSITLAILVLTAGYNLSAKQEIEDREMLVINIASKIYIDKNLKKALEEELMQKAKDDGRMITKKWAGMRGVTEVQTSVDCDECGNTQQADTRCTECGGKLAEISGSADETRCACSKPQPKGCCSSKPCNGCSSCCK